MSGVQKALEVSKKIDFSNLLKKLNSFPAQRLSLSQLEQQLLQARADATAFSASSSAGVAPIDFKTLGARVENPALVKAIEDAYKATAFPAAQAKPVAKEEQEEDKAWALKVQELSLKSALKSLEMRWEIQFLENNRFSKDTTWAEVKARYPEIWSEIDVDIQHGRKFKDIVPGF